MTIEELTKILSKTTGHKITARISTWYLTQDNAYNFLCNGELTAFGILKEELVDMEPRMFITEYTINVITRSIKLFYDRKVLK